MPAAAPPPFSPFIIVYGGEGLLIDRHLQRARVNKRKVICLDGDGLSDAALVDLCETYDDDPRIVVLDNAEAMKGDKQFAAYVERRDRADRMLILFAALRTAKLPKVWESAAAKGKSTECPALKPHDDKAFVRFIEAEARLNRVSITTDDAEYLLERVGPDLYRLANELQKLAVYVGPPGAIKEQHIEAVAAATPRTDPFIIADLVAKGDGRRALSLFDLLCAGESETKAMLTVLAALMKKTEQMVSIRVLLDRKALSDDEIAAQLGLNTWVYKTKWLPLVERRTLASLVAAMSRLCQLDEYVKSSQTAKRTMFEMAVLALSN